MFTRFETRLSPELTALIERTRWRLAMGEQMTMEQYLALPNRQALVGSPVNGRLYRDPAYPTLVFMSRMHPYDWNIVQWSAFSLALLDEAGVPPRA